MKLDIKKEVEAVQKALREDEGYYYVWQANIAVQFQDAWQRAVDEGGLPCKPEHIHEISNKAAKYFLNLFIRENSNP